MHQAKHAQALHLRSIMPGQQKKTITKKSRIASCVLRLLQIYTPTDHKCLRIWNGFERQLWVNIRKQINYSLYHLVIQSSCIHNDTSINLYNMEQNRQVYLESEVVSYACHSFNVHLVTQTRLLQSGNTCRALISAYE